MRKDRVPKMLTTQKTDLLRKKFRTVPTEEIISLQSSNTGDYTKPRDKGTFRVEFKIRVYRSLPGH